jgi:uncharacterized protein with HEPN domain
MSRDPATLADMLDACRSVLQFRGAVDLAGFLENREKQSAVLHQLMVIGEAAKRLSTGFRAAHPEMPWSDIAGMRDRLIHEYDDVDLMLVWTALDVHVVQLMNFLEPFVPKAPE